LAGNVSKWHVFVVYPDLIGLFVMKRGAALRMVT
jgi:hypothetical protein